MTKQKKKTKSHDSAGEKQLITKQENGRSSYMSRRKADTNYRVR